MSCTKLQLPPESLTRGLPPQDPRSLCPLSSTEFVESPHPPRTKFLCAPLEHMTVKQARRDTSSASSITIAPHVFNHKSLQNIFI